MPVGSGLTSELGPPRLVFSDRYSSETRRGAPYLDIRPPDMQAAVYDSLLAGHGYSLNIVLTLNAYAPGPRNHRTIRLHRSPTDRAA
jgi:hypothetical protein